LTVTEKKRHLVDQQATKHRGKAMAGCDPQSFFDQQVTLTDDLTKLAYFDSLSQDQFDEQKKSGSLGAMIPIDGVPINFNLSYDEARTLIDQLRRIKNVNYSEEHHKTILTSILSDTGLEAYKACVAGKGGVGTYLWISRNAATSSNFFIGVKWLGGVNGPVGEFNLLPGSQTPFQVIGGNVVGEYALTPPTTIMSEQEITVEVQRDLSQDFQFTTSISGHVADERIFLPKYQPKPVKFVVTKSNFVVASSSFGDGGNDGGSDDKNPEFDALDNEEFLPPTAQIVGHTDGEHSEIRILKAEPKRIFWHVWAKTATKDHGAWAGGYVSVIAATWS
jgi:hypothetical protein